MNWVTHGWKLVEYWMISWNLIGSHSTISVLLFLYSIKNPRFFLELCDAVFELCRDALSFQCMTLILRSYHVCVYVECKNSIIFVLITAHSGYKNDSKSNKNPNYIEIIIFCKFYLAKHFMHKGNYNRSLCSKKIFRIYEIFCSNQNKINLPLISNKINSFFIHSSNFELYFTNMIILI